MGGFRFSLAFWMITDAVMVFLRSDLELPSWRAMKNNKDMYKLMDSFLNQQQQRRANGLRITIIAHDKLFICTGFQ